MRPKNKHEKTIAELHIRLIESKNGIRTMHTEINGDTLEFHEVGNILAENHENSRPTIALIKTLAQYITDKIAENKDLEKSYER